MASGSCVESSALSPQDDEHSAMKKWFKRKIGLRKHQASPTSGHSDAPNARPTTTTTDVLNTSVLPLPSVPPLPVSPAKPSTVPRPTGILDHNSNRAQGNPSPNTLREAPSPIATSTSFQVSLPSDPSDGQPVITNYNGAAAITKGEITFQTGGLPSQVEATLAACPKFRILLVGNTGVGKTSLVSHVFNIVFNVSLDGTLDIAHDRVGIADISHEYYSDQNPRFILHDSMGFEPGYIEKSEIVKSFLQKRAECSAELPNQVHAIWLCIETPRGGSRLLQTGDEDLLELAKNLKIPVIIVLTKYDLLVMEHYRACGHISSVNDKKVQATKRAKDAFSKVTKTLKVPFVPVSTKADALRVYGEAMLVQLTQVTQDNLQDVKGSLRALWATAQQINARQKVELSISEGIKRYWRNLGESAYFQGHRLVDCIARIHDDLLKVWNFNDPSKVLSGEEFLNEMMGLVEPLSVEVIRNQQADDIATNADAIDSSLVLPALGTIIEMAAFQFLRGKYQNGVSTATFLAAYIVDLTLVLYNISTVVTANHPTRLSRDLVMEDAMVRYKSRSSHIHSQVREVAFKLEEKIVSVIRDEVGSNIQVT